MQAAEEEDVEKDKGLICLNIYFLRGPSESCFGEALEMAGNGNALKLQQKRREERERKDKDKREVEDESGGAAKMKGV